MASKPKIGLSFIKPINKPLLKPSIFNNDDDKDETLHLSELKSANYMLLKTQQYNQKVMEDKKMEIIQNKEESIDSYDDHYDDLQEIKNNKIQVLKEDKIKRESKYISTLLKHSEKRKIENDIIYEKKLLKERKTEDSTFGDKPKYITSSYKIKLQEQNKYKQEQLIKDKLEEESYKDPNKYNAFMTNVWNEKIKDSEPIKTSNDPNKVSNTQPETFREKTPEFNYNDIKIPDSFAPKIAMPKTEIILEIKPEVELIPEMPKVDENKALSAKERYLQRKKEAEIKLQST